MFNQTPPIAAMINPLSADARNMLAGLPSQKLRLLQPDDAPDTVDTADTADTADHPPSSGQTEPKIDDTPDAFLNAAPPTSDEDELRQINPYLVDNLATGKWLAYDINKGAKQVDIIDNKSAEFDNNIVSDIRHNAPLVFKKKLVQPRFSRRRYLREYNGLRLLPALLSSTGFAAVLITALVINFGILIPKTASNNQIAAAKDDLVQTIATLKPQVQSLSTQHLALQNTLADIKARIPAETETRQYLDEVLDDMNNNRAIRLIQHHIQLETAAEDELSFLVFNLKLETGFITWMEHREKLFQSLIGVKVHQETLTAPPRQSTIIVETQMHIPVLSG
jgi:hypothetical protein